MACKVIDHINYYFINYTLTYFIIFNCEVERERNKNKKLYNYFIKIKKKYYIFWFLDINLKRQIKRKNNKK